MHLFHRLTGRQWSGLGVLKRFHTRGRMYAFLPAGSPQNDKLGQIIEPPRRFIKSTLNYTYCCKRTHVTCLPLTESVGEIYGTPFTWMPFIATCKFRFCDSRMSLRMFISEIRPNFWSDLPHQAENCTLIVLPNTDDINKASFPTPGKYL